MDSQVVRMDSQVVRIYLRVVRIHLHASVKLHMSGTICILYKPTKFQLSTDKCKCIGKHFTLHVGMSYNLYMKN